MVVMAVLGGLKQIPWGTVKVFEHGNLAVRFFAWVFAEMDACGSHGSMFGVEIVCDEEITNAVASLLANGCYLRRVGRLGDEKRSFRIRARSHSDPPFAGLRGVFKHDKAECIPEPRNGAVVVVTEISDKGEGLGHQTEVFEIEWCTTFTSGTKVRNAYKADLRSCSDC